MAVVGEIPAEQPAHAFPAFPARSEIWFRLLEGYRAESAASRSRIARAA